MNAELKSIHSRDAPGADPDAFKPEDSTYFSLGVDATIGPAGERDGERFTFPVCSPSWLTAQPLTKGFGFQRHRCSSSAGIPTSSSERSPTSAAEPAAASSAGRLPAQVAACPLAQR
jgi:Immunity protein 8